LGELARDVCGFGAGPFHSRRRRVAVIEPSRGGGTNPVAGPASAPLAAGPCCPLGSGTGTSAEPRRARRFLAPASTDLPGPALERTPRLPQRSPAMRRPPRALGRAPHGARGVSLRLRRRCPSGAVPGAQRPGVRVPRARWHERRPARSGASPRSLLRRDVTAPWGVTIAAATRAGPGADAGRQQPDTLGRRNAADGRGRSAPPSQRCTQHRGPDPDRRLVASRRRHRAAITCRTNTCDMWRPLPWLDMARTGTSMPSRPNAHQ
jgi:hypothetical protein